MYIYNNTGFAYILQSQITITTHFILKLKQKPNTVEHLLTMQSDLYCCVWYNINTKQACETTLHILCACTYMVLICKMLAYASNT